MSIYQFRRPMTRSLRASSSAQAQLYFDGEEQELITLPDHHVGNLTHLPAFSTGSIDVARSCPNASISSDNLPIAPNAVTAKAGEHAASVIAFIADVNSDIRPTRSKAHPDAVLRSSMQHLAKRTVAKVARSVVAEYLIFGLCFKSTSTRDRLRKQHGYYLPNALGLIPSHHGLVLWQQDKIGQSGNTFDRARSNKTKTLRPLEITPIARNRPEYETDLIVYCHHTGWSAALAKMRGGGPDATAKDDLIPKPTASASALASASASASALTCPYWAREKDLQPTLTDAGVKDFIRLSGFPESISVKGWNLDGQFGCAIEKHIAYFYAYSRVCAARLMAVVRLADSEANANPEDLIDTVWAMRPGMAADLLTPIKNQYLSIAQFAESCGVALTRLKMSDVTEVSSKVVEPAPVSKLRETKNASVHMHIEQTVAQSIVQLKRLTTNKRQPTNHAILVGFDMAFGEKCRTLGRPNLIEVPCINLVQQFSVANSVVLAKFVRRSNFGEPLPKLFPALAYGRTANPNIQSILGGHHGSA